MNKTTWKSKTHWKSKTQRRKWWFSLTSDQQGEQIKKWRRKKAERRRKKSAKIMSKTKNRYKCDGCFHRKTKSCEDDMPHGCEYWFDPKSKIVGLAYLTDEN